MYLKKGHSFYKSLLISQNNNDWFIELERSYITLLKLNNSEQILSAHYNMFFSKSYF